MLNGTMPGGSGADQQASSPTNVVSMQQPAADAVPPPDSTAPVPVMSQTQASTFTATPTPASTYTAPVATRPSSIPPATLAPPEKPAAHGSPTRVYLNQNITPHLLEGMKYLAAYEPEKPLKWLSEFLARKSAEIEGS